MQTLPELDLPHLSMEEPAFAADPFPHFSAARTKHPWLARSVFGLVVTEYAAMKDLLWMNDTLRTANDGIVAIMGAKGSPWGRNAEENIFAQQGDNHRRLRDAVAPIFTPRHANAIRPMVREVIDGLLDHWAPLGGFDFEEFASYFPISVISNMIGGPLSEIPRLRSTLETLGGAFAMDPAQLPALDAAQLVMEEFVQNLIAKRRADSRHEGEEDLLDKLIGVGAEGRMSEREIVLLVTFMYAAGYDTSKNVLSLTMRQLIDLPELYQRCATDHDFCGKVIKEMLRYCSVSTSFRVTKSDVEYRGVLLPRDTMLFFPVSVSGRDPDAFSDADRLDPERPAERNHHIAFGRGAHVCLGQHIAQVQLQEGLHRIAQRIREPRLAGEIAWRPFPGIWGLRRLPITFTPA